MEKLKFYLEENQIKFKYKEKHGGIIPDDIEHVTYWVLDVLINHYINDLEHKEEWYPVCDYIRNVKNKDFFINPNMIEFVKLSPIYMLMYVHSIFDEVNNFEVDYNITNNHTIGAPTIDFVYSEFSGASSYCDCCGYHNYESKDLFINEESVLHDWTDNHMSSGVDTQKVGEVLIKELEKHGLADSEEFDLSPRKVLTLLDDAFTIHRNHEYYGDYDEYLHHSVFRYSQLVLDVTFNSIVNTNFESKHEYEEDDDEDDDPYFDYDDDDDE